MIEINNVYTGNWEAAIRSMRNPMNSWDKSDSGYGCSEYNPNIKCSACSFKPDYCGISNNQYILGPNDHKLALQLATAGSDHGKFLRSIIFSCDINAPMYWWKETDTYKVGTVRNSCSTMHKIMSKEFEPDDFSHDKMLWDGCGSLDTIIDYLNDLRTRYLELKTKPTKDIEERKYELKKIWYTIIQLLPSSYNQKATWTANYEVLRNIYHARKNHKLEEWHEFCAMIEKLPYSELITEPRGVK